MNFQTIRFNPTTTSDFTKILRKRVNAYFKTKDISRHANGKMKFKTIFMIALCFVPYGFIVSGMVSTPWAFILLWAVMGMGVAGIGLSVMHDANHDAYSKNKRVNRMLGYFLNLMGGNSANWRMQHNVLHHSFTNVDGVDEDITVGKLVRLSPHQPRLKIHRLQHIYAWFLYSLMTVQWVLTKDYVQLHRYKKMGLIEGQNLSYSKLLTEMLLFKVVYYGYVVVIPFLVVPIAWYWIALGIVVMLVISGLVLSAIFQPAHVMPTADFPIPDKTGNIDNDWAVHQLATTTNFAPKSTIFSWYVGGLNFQIEHHLFPNICHIHYKEISRIVKETANEFNLPYYSEPTFAMALIKHTRMLKNLGKFDHLPGQF